MWRAHYYEGEQEVFQSFDQWHQDGLEFEVSNFFGLSCQGTWIHKGPGTVQLFHTGWNFDANGQLTGYFNEVQTVTVSVDGQAYDGTFLVRKYDLNGRNRRGRVHEFFLRAANRPKSNTKHRYQEQSRGGCRFKSKGCSRLL